MPPTSVELPPAEPFARPVEVPAPPAPTVTVILEPTVTEYPVADKTPPAPPPPPPLLELTTPPPPPPATHKYSTAVTG